MKKFILRPSRQGGTRPYKPAVAKRLIIGVSGKIGSGKTTFCKILKKYGFFHVETDKVVHNLYKKGGRGSGLVKLIFGQQYLAAGCVNRTRLRNYFLTGHVKFKLFLNKLYPLVAAEIRKIIASSHAQRVALEFIDFDIPHFKKLIDKSVYIDCSKKNILQRHASKKFPADYLKKVMALQKKPKKIDFIIANNSTKRHLREAAKMIYLDRPALAGHRSI